jgi:hypothetical protein
LEAVAPGTNAIGALNGTCPTLMDCWAFAALKLTIIEAMIANPQF